MHYNQAAVFTASHERVLEAVAAAVDESFRGWRIEPKSDGFVAQGYRAWHETTATIHVEPTPDGTKVAVELLVKRASALGFMWFDISGYYDGQIRKCLASVSRQLGQPVSESKVGRGCITGFVVAFVVGLGLGLCAIPLDTVVFGQSPGSAPGPFGALASIFGLSAGIVAFIYVVYPEASLWKSIGGRPPRTRNEKRE